MAFSGFTKMVLIMRVSVLYYVLCNVKMSGYLTVGFVVVMDSMVAKSSEEISISLLPPVWSSSIRMNCSGCEKREGRLMMSPSSY